MTDGVARTPSAELYPAIGRNRAANYFAFATTAIVGFVANPILLGLLGANSFGAWKAIQKLFEAALATQGGSTQAMKWVIARRTTGDDPQRTARLLGAALAQWRILLAPLSALTLALVLVLPAAFPGIKAPELYGTGLALGLTGMAAGALSLPAAALIGAGKGYLAMVVTTLATLAGGLAMVAAAHAGWGLQGLAGATLVGAIVSGWASWHLARRHVPGWGFARPSPGDSAHIRRLGSWTMGWTWIERVLLGSDIIIVALAAGTATAAQFAFATYPVQLMLALCLLTANAAMPELGRLLAGGPTPMSDALLSRVRAINLALLTVAGFGILALNESFVSLWAGLAMYPGDGLNLLIVIGAVQLAHIRNEAQILDTVHAVRPRVLLSAAALGLGLGLALLALWLTGEIAAALIAMIGGRAILNAGLPFLAARACGEPHTFSPIALAAPAILLAIGAGLSTLIGPLSPALFAFAVGALGALGSLYVWRFVMPPGFRGSADR